MFAELDEKERNTSEPALGPPVIPGRIDSSPVPRVASVSERESRLANQHHKAQRRQLSLYSLTSSF